MDLRKHLLSVSPCQSKILAFKEQSTLVRKCLLYPVQTDLAYLHNVLLHYKIVPGKLTKVTRSSMKSPDRLIKKKGFTGWCNCRFPFPTYHHFVDSAHAVWLAVLLKYRASIFWTDFLRAAIIQGIFWTRGKLVSILASWWRQRNE